MRKIKDKIIVITGGTGGLGKELAGLLGGDNTVIDLARSVTTEGNDYCVDVSDRAQVEAAFADIARRFGRVDLLINNAGYGVSGAIELLEQETVDRIMAVNFNGALYVTQCALPLMGKGSRIVFVSSACAIFPLPFRTMYCASKAAVSMLGYSLRAEVAPYGIDVVTICPGDIKTGFTQNRVKCFTTNARYGGRIQAADEHITAREHKRMPVAYAGRKMYAILAKKRTRPMYLIGKKYKFLYALYRLVPLGVLCRAIGAMFAPADKS